MRRERWNDYERERNIFFLGMSSASMLMIFGQDVVQSLFFFVASPLHLMFLFSHISHICIQPWSVSGYNPYLKGRNHFILILLRFENT